MPAGIMFWILMILWFVISMYYNWPNEPNKYGLAGERVLFFALFFLIGWKLFGFVIQ